MNQRERNDLDRHITGNYGEDQLREESGMCIWDDCDKDAIYCEGHAREYMQPDIDALRSRNAELVEVLKEAELWLNIAVNHLPNEAIADRNRATGEMLKIRGARDVANDVCTRIRAVLAKAQP